MTRFVSHLVLLAVLATALPLFAVDAPLSQLARIKDVATVEGVRDNQLIGYGIVVGLHSTGDSSQTVFPYQTLISTLERMGVNLPQGQATASLQERNMAAVFIAATLPPFARPGNRIDVIVSSAGDARSIEGGLLLMTPLYGPDGQIYAQAQGPLVLGGYSVQGGGNSKTVNDPDFRTAELVASSINKSLGRDAAHAADSRRIEIAALPDDDIPELLARVESIDVQVFPRAKVVVNERTGTIVIGGEVRLQPVSILHGGLVVNVISRTEVSQPNALSSGTTQVVQQTTIQAQDKPANRIELREDATVDDLVQSLQQIGATSRDIISILQAMKEAGALEADLEVM